MAGERKAENKDGNFSQMHYARQGQITDEMRYIAETREDHARIGAR